MITRFEQEAQVTAHLESPHTVDLHDFGIGDDGTLFYVMELLEGIDLDSMIRRFGPMPAERVVYVLHQVCASLAEAHQRALVHRDIKPANIVLCQHGLECDFVKVLDFGLVKRLPRLDGADGANVSRSNVVLGPPAFLAPEVREAGVGGRAGQTARRHLLRHAVDARTRKPMVGGTPPRRWRRVA